MLIRPAKIEDYARVCAIFDEVDAQHRKALPHIFRDPGDTARSRAYITSIVEDENACLWIAKHEGQVVGILHILIRETRDIPILVPRRYAVIDNIAVSTTHRRKGIGRALVQAADRWAVERGIDQIELHVWEFNEGARAFYEKLGYRTAGRRMCRNIADKKVPTEPDTP
jgi:ribosomal protein S18 acetylase RimI-like enzyme